MDTLLFFLPPVVLPHLHKLALGNNSQTVEAKRIDIATQLFEAYSALSCCCILPEVIRSRFKMFEIIFIQVSLCNTHPFNSSLSFY